MKLSRIIIIAVVVAVVALIVGWSVGVPQKADDFNSAEDAVQKQPNVTQNVSLIPIRKATFDTIGVEWWANLTNVGTSTPGGTYEVKPYASKGAWPAITVSDYSGASPTYYWKQGPPNPLYVVGNVTAKVYVTVTITANFESALYIYNVTNPVAGGSQQSKTFYATWSSHTDSITMLFPSGASESRHYNTTFQPGTVYFWERGGYTVGITAIAEVSWHSSDGHDWTQSAWMDWGTQTLVV